MIDSVPSAHIKCKQVRKHYKPFYNINSDFVVYNKNQSIYRPTTISAPTLNGCCFVFFFSFEKIPSYPLVNLVRFLWLIRRYRKPLYCCIYIIRNPYKRTDILSQIDVWRCVRVRVLKVRSAVWRQERACKWRNTLRVCRAGKGGRHEQRKVAASVMMNMRATNSGTTHWRSILMQSKTKLAV